MLPLEVHKSQPRRPDTPPSDDEDPRCVFFLQRRLPLKTHTERRNIADKKRKLEDGTAVKATAENTQKVEISQPSNFAYLALLDETVRQIGTPPPTQPPQPPHPFSPLKITSTPCVSTVMQDTQIRGASELDDGRTDGSSFSWDTEPTPSTNVALRSAQSQPPAIQGSAYKAHEGSFSWDTTANRVSFPTDHDDPAPVVIRRSPKQDIPNPGHGTDAMEAEQFIPRRIVTNLASGSFCWDDRNSGGDLQMNRDDSSQSFHPAPILPPQNSLPLDPVADAMEVEQLPFPQPLANLNNNSFCWEGASPTRGSTDVKMREGSFPQSSRTNLRAPSPGRPPSTSSADAMHTARSLSPASTVVNLSRDSFHRDNTSQVCDPSEDIPMEESDGIQPLCPRPLLPSQSPLPSSPAAGAMQVAQYHPTRPLANLPSGPSRWHDLTPKHNPGGTRPEGCAVSGPSNSIRGPTLAVITHGSFDWGNLPSTLDSGNEHAPPPQTRLTPHRTSRNPRPQNWRINVNKGPVPGKACRDLLPIAA